MGIRNLGLAGLLTVLGLGSTASDKGPLLEVRCGNPGSQLTAVGTARGADPMMPRTLTLGNYDVKLFEPRYNGRPPRITMLSGTTPEVRPYLITGIDNDADGKYEEGVMVYGEGAGPYACYWGDSGQAPCTPKQRGFADLQLRVALQEADACTVEYLQRQPRELRVDAGSDNGYTSESRSQSTERGSGQNGRRSP